MHHYLTVLKMYAVVNGRCRRKTFWLFLLFSTLFSLACSAVDELLGLKVFSDQGLLSLVYSVAVLIPSVAVGVRRLHDLDRSGWWLLIMLIPLLGTLLLLIYFCLRGTVGPNRFGPDPLDEAAPAQ
ncbi:MULTISPECIES: DUF805 domain-containing protein [Pantoea]|uniref:DUF805 domain-containing protein n=1 Tax=Pantoea TaxID=53335 RepID=UPI000EA1B6A0|nr:MULTISPECIES: DUF805 domain-containing protein [Pantoea]MDU6433352.1 DUF805 domain-containing protein [Pantoea sp.]MBZ6385596.1 DUF805 domain-containing protein [Pantoea piersonii]MBZ6398371.1 DUF805 domain-containing protein [Pantoea piersonii]MBZ6408435.1 DUF805 domain-containing protein [Pantoea piersonii]MBZ6429336.1 DUF805 domain-containing protein [Pantoea piersonii]